MPKIVVALYRELNTAEEVVRELVDNGFRREDIGLVAQNREGTEIASGTSPEPGGANTAAGAGAGAVLGGLAGLVVGLGALAIPGIGPIIAAGPLATALAGAGIGAVAGGLIGALTSAGVPEQDARGFAEGVRQGGTLVTVRAADDRVDQAAAIMNGHNPLDINDQTRRLAGQAAETPAAAPGQGEAAINPGDYGLAAGTPPPEPAETGTPYHSLPPAELGMAQPGWTDVEAPEAEAAGLEETAGATAAEDAGANQPNTAPGKPDLSREGEQGISGEGNRGEGRPRDFADLENDFRQHYELVYAGGAQDYYFFEPGYRFGYDLAGMDQYRGRHWSEIEPDARRDWERTQTEKPWDKIREAVRHGWERTTGTQGASDSTAGNAPLRPGNEEYGGATGEGRYTDPNRP